jgi:hypothetical protein
MLVAGSAAVHVPEIHTKLQLTIWLRNEQNTRTPGRCALGPAPMKESTTLVALRVQAVSDDGRLARLA